MSHNNEIKQLKEVSLDLHDQIEGALLDGGDIMNVVKNNPDYINEIFNVATRMEQFSEENVKELIDMGLEINQVFSGMDGDCDNCIFALHCAEFRQKNTIVVMLQNGLIVPTKETLNAQNNIIDILICGHSYGDIDESIFCFILDNLSEYPISLSEGCTEMIEEFYNDLDYEYRQSLISFLLKAYKNK